jgi:hypothetical protein
MPLIADSRLKISLSQPDGKMSPKHPLNQPPIRNLESGIWNHVIYTGSFAALEARWIDVIVELQTDDPLLEINVLVGSNILASYLKRRFAQTGRAMANVRFHTFLDLASRLSAASGKTPEKRRLPNLGNSILLEDILAAHTPAVYAPLAGLAGFRAALLDTSRNAGCHGSRSWYEGPPPASVRSGGSVSQVSGTRRLLSRCG